MHKEEPTNKPREIERDIFRVDAADKATGKARFTADFNIPGMLFANLVRSPHPHARIRKIDTSKAEILPGVRRIVRPEEAPEKRSGLYIEDRYLLPRDGIVRFVGNPIAIAVADNKTIAREASELIDIEYEILPATFDSEEAMSSNPPVKIHPELHQYVFATFPRYPKLIDAGMPNVFHISKIRCGDLEKGFAEADLIIENRYSSATLQHAPLETTIADAWMDEEGNISFRSSRQGIHMARAVIAETFGMDPSKVRAMSPYVGGAFGSKVDTWIECLAVLASIKSGKPVRIEYSREEQFIAGGHRPRTTIYIKDGLRKDGKITAREMKVIFDAGAYGAAGAYISTNVCMWSLGGTYRFPNFKSDTYSVYTNHPPTCTFRAVETPEVTWATESQMDTIAKELKLDPLELRRINLLSDGDKTIWGETVHNINPVKCLEAAADWIDWYKKPGGEGVWRKGKGFAVAGYVTLAMPCSAVVKIHHDGLIEARVGPDELGQGFQTAMALICAREFGISLDRVKVVTGDTAIVPFSLPSIASQSTVNCGNALLRACQDAQRRLFELAGPYLHAAPDKLSTREGWLFHHDSHHGVISIQDLFNLSHEPHKKTDELIGKGDFFPPAPSPVDPQTGQTEMVSPVWSHLAYAVEVAVNLETGETKVLRVGAGFDIGKTINQKALEGQIEGGIAMGIGAALFEQIILDHGVVSNPNFQDYKLPTSFETPRCGAIKCISKNVPDPHGPYGAKGAGELPNIAIAPALGNAISNAIGVRIRELPITREKILSSLRKHDSPRDKDSSHQSGKP